MEDWHLAQNPYRTFDNQLIKIEEDGEVIEDLILKIPAKFLKIPEQRTRNIFDD